MVIFVPGTEETDPKKQNMSLQQLGSAVSTTQSNIAALQATGLPNTLNLGGTQFGELTYQFGTAGAPATSGTTDANVASRFGVQSVALDVGAYGSGVTWLQARLQSNLATNFALALNPNGGGVAIGKNSAATALDVNGTVTATAVSAATLAGQVSLTTLTNSLGANVSLTNTALYFDGPSVAQGTSGTWYASGVVTFFTNAASSFFAKLWDGTTVIQSSAFTTASNGYIGSISLSGYITNPAGNIRISVRDIGTTAGALVFNSTGSGKDCTVSVLRIA